MVQKITESKYTKCFISDRALWMMRMIYFSVFLNLLQEVCITLKIGNNTFILPFGKND